jgi:RNA polymerase sigma-70 factor (ECF subfamily)
MVLGAGSAQDYDQLFRERELRPRTTMTTAAVYEVPPLDRGISLPRDPATERNARLRRLVDSHIDFVARVLRNSGTPQAEVDDEVQRTFIVAARRLDDMRVGAEKSFLFRIALNLAAHARRTLARRREVSADQAPEQIERFATPEALTDQKRMRELLDRVLDQMDESLRATFVLHEFEEMSTSEIAELLGIPRGTVASRLRRARIEFRERVGAIEAFGQRERET